VSLLYELTIATAVNYEYLHAINPQPNPNPTLTLLVQLILLSTYTVVNTKCLYSLMLCFIL